MKAVAILPGKPNSTHLADLPEPSVQDIHKELPLAASVARAC
jgi:hypothetical protein